MGLKEIIQGVVILIIALFIFSYFTDAKVNNQIKKYVENIKDKFNSNIQNMEKDLSNEGSKLKTSDYEINIINVEDANTFSYIGPDYSTPITRIEFEIINMKSRSINVAVGGEKIVTKLGEQLDSEIGCESFNENLYSNVKKTFSFCMPRLDIQDHPILYFRVASDFEYKPSGIDDPLFAYSPQGGNVREFNVDLIQYLKRDERKVQIVEPDLEAMGIKSP